MNRYDIAFHKHRRAKRAIATAGLIVACVAVAMALCAMTGVL